MAETVSAAPAGMNAVVNPSVVTSAAASPSLAPTTEQMMDVLKKQGYTHDQLVMYPKHALKDLYQLCLKKAKTERPSSYGSSRRMSRKSLRSWKPASVSRGMPYASYTDGAQQKLAVGLGSEPSLNVVPSSSANPPTVDISYMTETKSISEQKFQRFMQLVKMIQEVQREHETDQEKCKSRNSYLDAEDLARCQEEAQQNLLKIQLAEEEKKEIYEFLRTLQQDRRQIYQELATSLSSDRLRAHFASKMKADFEYFQKIQVFYATPTENVPAHASSS